MDFSSKYFTTFYSLFSSLKYYKVTDSGNSGIGCVSEIPTSHQRGVAEESATALPSPQQSDQDEEFTSTLTTVGAVEPTVDDVENARRASSELSIDSDNVAEPLDMPTSEQTGVAEQSSAGK